jgi:hypothetical protein
MDDLPGDLQTSASDFAKAQAQERDAAKNGIAGLRPNGSPWRRSEIRRMTQPEFKANQASILVAMKNGSIVDDVNKRPPNTKPTAGLKTSPAGKEHSPELQVQPTNTPTGIQGGGSTLPATDLDGN